MPYQYPPLQKKLFITIEEYNKAYRLVEQAEKPDPRPMLAIVARFMEANSRIFGLVRNAHDAVAGFDWQILPADDSEKAAAIATATRERLIASGLHHHFDVLMDGEFFGLTALRQVWRIGPLGMTANLDIIPTTQLVMIAAGNATVPALIAYAPDFAAMPIDQREQYIISAFNPFKSTRPLYVGGLIRAAIPLTIIKNFSWHDWALFNEVFGQPFRTAEYKVGTQPDEIAKAKEALDNFGRNAWGLFSENIKFQLHEAARNGTISAYKELLDKIDAELAILINGEANTTELPDRGGSRAAVQTLKLVADDRMWWRLKRLEHIINEQYIAVDYRLNISETDIALRPRFAFSIEETSDREANARIISDLKNAGVPLKRREVYEKTGFTPPEAGDEVI